MSDMTMWHDSALAAAADRGITLAELLAQLNDNFDFTFDEIADVIDWDTLLVHG